MSTYPQQPYKSNEKTRADRAELWLKLAAAVVGLLTAGITTLGVAAGLFAKKANTANEKVDTSQQQIQNLKEENSTLKQQVAQLQSAASRATATPEALPTSDSDPAPAPTGSSTEPLVRHEGPLLVRPGVLIDLDATPDDPQWGTTGGEGKDLSFSRDRLTTWYRTKWVITSQNPSYDVCHNTQGYSSEDLPLTVVKRAKTLCVLTEGGRQSVLSVKSVGPDELRFQVTTFNKTGD